MKLSKQRALSVVSDPRFSRLHFDPRFQRAFKRKLKIPIDSRFRHIFSDKRFADPLAVDKRGRPKRKSKKDKRQARHSLHQYYDIEDDNGDGPDAASDGDGDGVDIMHGNGGQDEVYNEPAIDSKADRKTEEEKEKHNVGEEEEEEERGGDDEFMRDKPVEGKRQVHMSIQQQMGEITHRQSSDDDTLSSEDSGESSSSENTRSSSEDGSDVGEELEQPEEEAEAEKIPVTDKETQRLALISMDWDHLKAVDILAVMNSFLPKGGRITSVSVYPSEFGLQQMKEEEQRGPQGVFQTEDSDDDGNEMEGDGINMEKLRQYEKAKLRYYYAVIECDSSATANFIYESCDGMEFERTANTIDLRFIPDDMKFMHHPRDVATEVPSDYQAPLFETKALQHSRVKLTWDDDEPDRVKTLHQKFNAEQLNEMDFKAYLASDVSSSDLEDVEEDSLSNGEAGDSAGPNDLNEGEESEPINRRLRHKYRALLGSDGASDSKDSKDGGKELEITFHSGLDELSKRLVEKKKNNTEETVWQAYLRKKKEKRKEQKKAEQSEDDEYESDDDQQIDDPFFTHDDADFEDPFFKGEDKPSDAKVDSRRVGSKRGDAERTKQTVSFSKTERAQKKAELEKRKLEEERGKAELELLFADENAMAGKKGYNLKKKKLKGKNKEGDKLPEKLPTADYEDPRFSALFTSHRFALDPTEPEFKRSAAQLRPLLEKQQKRFSQGRPLADTNVVASSNLGDSKVPNKTKHELSLMVRSLKRKAGVSDQ